MDMCHFWVSLLQWCAFQPCSVTYSCPTFCDPMGCGMPGFPVLHHLPELAQTHVHWVGDIILLSRPLLSPSTFNLRASGSFPVSCSHQVATIGDSASASVLPMNIQNWFPLGWTGWISLQSKNPLQHHSSKASILRCWAFTVQLSHPHITTGKAIALTRRTFVGKGMALLFNMLSRLITTFLPRSKCLNFMAAVTICRDFEAQEKVLSLFPLFTHLFAMRWWDWMPWSGAVLSCCSHVLLLRPMGHSPPGPSVHGVIQARVLEWVATPSFRGSSQPMILGFWMLNFKPAFSLFHLHQEAL